MEYKPPHHVKVNPHREEPPEGSWGWSDPSKLDQKIRCFQPMNDHIMMSAREKGTETAK
jgi:hypothetical protein